MMQEKEPSVAFINHGSNNNNTTAVKNNNNNNNTTTTRKQIVTFQRSSSDEYDDDYDYGDEQTAAADEDNDELIVYMDESSRLFNIKHRNHYATATNSPSSSSKTQQYDDNESTTTTTTTTVGFENSPKISYSNRKRRVSVWIPTLNNNLISSLTAKVSNTVEFDFKKKNLLSSPANSTTSTATSTNSTSTNKIGSSSDKKYIVYSIDVVIGFNHTKCQWSLTRRYNEFKKFYSLLKKATTNKELFSQIKFPSKSPITTFNDTNLLENRKRLFNEFLSSVISMVGGKEKSGNNQQQISSFEFLIYYFLDIHNSPVSFLFDHPYSEVFKQINQFYQTSREEKRRLKRLIEIERNYDEEQCENGGSDNGDNGQYLLREQEWYESKFRKLDELNRELNELRLKGDDFFIDYKGKPHILSVDKLSSSLHLYLLSESGNSSSGSGNGSKQLDHQFVQQIYIDSIQMIRECNNTYRGDGFEMIEIQLLSSNTGSSSGGNSSVESFYVFDRKELIYSIGAQVNQYKLAKSKFISFLVQTVLKLKREKYDEDNSLHEQDLLELYNQLQPDDPLIARKSKQWINIGFQGDNPSTDFRGGGYMSLKMLLFFARHDDQLMRSLIANHADYPFCVSGINLFFTLCTMLDLENLSPSQPQQPSSPNSSTGGSSGSVGSGSSGVTPSSLNLSNIENIEERFPLFRFICLQLVKMNTTTSQYQYGVGVDQQDGVDSCCEFQLFGQAFIVLCQLLHKVFIDSAAGYMDYQSIVEKSRKLLEEALLKRPNDFDCLKASLNLI